MARPDAPMCDHPACDKVASGVHRLRFGLSNGIEEILTFCGPEHMGSMKRAIQRRIDKAAGKYGENASRR